MAAYGGLAVVEGDAVVGEPGAEGFAPSSGDCSGELAFQLEELEDAWRERGNLHWRVGEGMLGGTRGRRHGGVAGRADDAGGRDVLGMQTAREDDGGEAEQKCDGWSTH